MSEQDPQQQPSLSSPVAITSESQLSEAALAASTQEMKTPIQITTKGGELSVNYVQRAGGSFEQITLCGPAKMVYAGSIEI